MRDPPPQNPSLSQPRASGARAEGQEGRLSSSTSGTQPEAPPARLHHARVRARSRPAPPQLGSGGWKCCLPTSHGCDSGGSAQPGRTLGLAANPGGSEEPQGPGRQTPGTAWAPFQPSLGLIPRDCKRSDPNSSEARARLITSIWHQLSLSAHRALGRSSLSKELQHNQLGILTLIHPSPKPCPVPSHPLPTAAPCPNLLPSFGRLHPSTNKTIPQ